MPTLRRGMSRSSRTVDAAAQDPIHVEGPQLVHAEYVHVLSWKTPMFQYYAFRYIVLRV